jgi:hypothetical protein
MVSRENIIQNRLTLLNKLVKYMSCVEWLLHNPLDEGHADQSSSSLIIFLQYLH